ncbi:MAG: hypothetical protein IJ748_00230 [Bacteroidales bacterium]|nr:hypothetical protein [Bacteroidales bacterium]
MASSQIIALLIFVFTYLGIALNGFPFVKLNRKTASFVGAVLMVICSVVSPQQALQSIDFNTIALLLGMMVIIAVLKLDGFFSFISRLTVSKAANASALLSLIVFITGFASAFLVNDAVVLLFTPVIISICKKSSLSPVPFLLGEIFSANAGSLMSITGNPQNMIIGINSAIPYGEFMLFMLPVALVSMLIIIWVIKKVYKNFDFKKPVDKQKELKSAAAKSMRISLTIFLLVITGFFIGKIIALPIPLIALGGAGLMFVFSKHKGEDIFKEVDFSLLLFFACLFVLVDAVKQSGVFNFVFTLSLSESMTSVCLLFLVSIVLSQLLSNVPYTVFMLPLMNAANSKILWLTLAAGSTLAGNLTAIGAMANLIVLEQAESAGVKITAKEFSLPAVIITLLTSAAAILFLQIITLIQG